MAFELRLPVNLASQHFSDNKQAYYSYLREHEPVHKGRVMLFGFWLVSRYEDCMTVLKHDKILRNRSTATGGGSRFPFPMPKSVRTLANSMITEDEPDHRRLRNLVHQAFVPRRLKHLENRIETLTHELLDKAEKRQTIDLIESYSLPIPVTVISEMVGVRTHEVPEFSRHMKALSGFGGLKLLQTLFLGLPQAIRFAKKLIERKRKQPADDILSGLIEAEDQGNQLSEDELVAMVFLLIFAGYETTVHLITNAVQTLLNHPDQLALLQQQPELMESAIEEVTRFNGPIHATKPGYTSEDITIAGVSIPKGKPVIPLLGSANWDPEIFTDPEVFDITRTPNRHLGFGHGIHFCLGAPLARMETRIALTNLLERNPDLSMAVPQSQLRIQRIPMWHRFETLPIKLR